MSKIRLLQVANQVTVQHGVFHPERTTRLTEEHGCLQDAKHLADWMDWGVRWGDGDPDPHLLAVLSEPVTTPKTPKETR